MLPLSRSSSQVQNANANAGQIESLRGRGEAKDFQTTALMRQSPSRSASPPGRTARRSIGDLRQAVMNTGASAVYKTAGSAAVAKTVSVEAETKEAVSTILNTLEILKKQTDLSPNNPAVNAALSKFVHDMTAPYHSESIKAVLGDPKVKEAHKDLLSLLSKSEGEMEHFWTFKFLTEASSDRASMKDFIYFDNYEELTDLELAHWGQTGDQPKKGDHVAFVGSGSLPLSALLLQEKTGAHVTCIDCDPKAVDQSSRLIKQWGMDKDVSVRQSGGEKADYTDFTHVIVAALVPDQPGVVNRILQDVPLARIGVRSAEGMRAVLYPPTDIKAIENLGLVHTGGSETNRRVINTMLTFRAAPRVMNEV